MLVFNPKDSFGYRFHSLLTLLSSKQISFIKDKEGNNLVEFDGKNCQPTLLANLNNSLVKTLAPDCYNWYSTISDKIDKIMKEDNMLFFKELVESSKIYDYIIELCKLYDYREDGTGELITKRMQAKNYVLCGLFSKTSTFFTRTIPTEDLFILNQTFPSILRLKKLFNSLVEVDGIDKGTFLVKLLQQMESGLFVDLFGLFLRNNGIKFFTKHDSFFISSKNNISDIGGAITNICSSLGLNLQFHIKENNQSLEYYLNLAQDSYKTLNINNRSHIHITPITISPRNFSDNTSQTLINSSVEAVSKSGSKLKNDSIKIVQISKQKSKEIQEFDKEFQGCNIYQGRYIKKLTKTNYLEEFNNNIEVPSINSTELLKKD
jgi:hypothetical protein